MRLMTHPRCPAQLARHLMVSSVGPEDRFGTVGLIMNRMKG